MNKRFDLFDLGALLFGLSCILVGVMKAEDQPPGPVAPENERRPRLRRDSGADGPNATPRRPRRTGMAQRPAEPPKEFVYDTNRDGFVDDRDRALYTLDIDGDEDIDLFDWAAWSADFRVPTLTVAIPLIHCPLFDGRWTRAFTQQNECPVGPSEVGIVPGRQVWFVAYNWPRHLIRWVQFATGPID